MNKPVRILQVVTTMNLGGLENFLMNLYRNIDREKIQFDFLMHRKEKGIFDDEIEAMGGRIYRFDAIRPLNYFKYKSELKKFFKQNPQYQIVHSHINQSSALVLTAAKGANVKVRIAHSHIAGTAGNYQIFRNIMKRTLLKVATHRFACSNNAGKWLYDLKSFQLFNNSIDTNKFKFSITKRTEIRKTLKLNEDDILIGNVSRFNTQKNHTFLIHVFAKYLNLNTNAKLILIGEGDLKESLLKQIEDLQITKNVILTGAIQNSHEYLNAMDFYLFTSLFEGLPLALVEAQCNGLPILMSNTISKDVIMTDLVSEKSLTETDLEWAATIMSLQKHHNFKHRESYQDVIKENGFDVAKNAKFAEEFYLNLLY
jgi:glycosyltransferase involved in cell wall biosynthesis